MTDSQESGTSEVAQTPETTDVAVDETNKPGTDQEEIRGKIVPKTAKKQRSFLQRLRSGWAAFRLWRYRRPFWGSILMVLASLLMLWGPVSILMLGWGLLPGSVVSLALLVGGLMLVMALAQLFVPAHALITGLIGIVLSVVSLITGSFGGFGIGMLIGILGSAQGVAWKANARPLPTKRFASRQKQKQRNRKLIH